MSLAPIIVFVFNRPQHTYETIEALKRNYLASETELFIYCDGPRDEQDIEKVNEVRSYVDSITGFKTITVIKSEVNKGLANSIINGVTDIINNYEKVIVLEDDLVSSPYFINYMNQSLYIYEDREDIWSISGYTPTLNINQNFNSIYLTYRGCSWGWATWKNRWERCDWDIKDYNDFKKSKKMRKKFNISGSDLSPMLDDQMNKRINSWAIRWVYNQFKYEMLTVYPPQSYIKNIGLDFSGTHSIDTQKYKTKLCDYLVQLDRDITVDNLILKKFKSIYDLNYIGYIGIFIKKIGLYKPIRLLRNKCMKKIYQKKYSKYLF